MLLIQYILFFIASVFSFYIPGKVLLQLLQIHLEKSQEIILRWILGICVFILFTYIFAWVHIDYLYLLILFLCFLFSLKSFKRKTIRAVLAAIDWISLLIIIFGSLAFLLVMFFSGWQTRDGMYFLGVNGTDGVRHIAYIKNQMIHFPPQQPGLAGETLRGFHYFYDFLLSRFALFYGFGVEDLYFRFFPLLISLVYGGGFYLFASLMTKQRVKIRWVLLFAYFSQSSAFLYLLFNPTVQIASINIVQPLGLIVNPFTVLSIGILLSGLALIPHVEKSWKYAVVVGVLLGIVSQMKVYAGLLGIFCILIYPVFLFIKKKSMKTLKHYVLAVFLTGLITAVTYLPNNYKAGGLVYAPLLFYRQYMQGWYINYLHWEIKRTIYAEHNNILRIILLYEEAIALFWLYNLGTRLILFAKITAIFRKDFWGNAYNFIFLSAFLFSVFLGSFFIQTVSVFDTVQFFWIALALLSIPSGLVLGDIWKRSGKKVKISLFLFFTICSAPGIIQFFLPYTRLTSIAISHDGIAVFHQVANAVPKNSFIVYLPEKSVIMPQAESAHTGTLIISAVTGRSVYVEQGGLPGRYETEYQKRTKQLYRLHLALQSCNEKEMQATIDKIGSKYLLTSNSYPCLASSSAVVKRIIGDSLKFYEFK